MRMDSPPRIKMKMMKRFEARSPMRRSIIVPIQCQRELRKDIVCKVGHGTERVLDQEDEADTAAECLAIGTYALDVREEEQIDAKESRHHSRGEGEEVA